jgi:hypothetical protein
MGDPFGPFTESLKMAIPLVLRKKSLEQEQQQFEALMGQKRMELEQEEEQERQKIAANQITKTFEVAGKTVDEALKRGDINTANQAAMVQEAAFATISGGRKQLYPRNPETGDIMLKAADARMGGAPDKYLVSYAMTHDGKYPDSPEQFAAWKKVAYPELNKPSNPLYQIIQSPTGYAGVNKRNPNEVVPIKSPTSGETMIPVSADVDLAGNKARATTKAKEDEKYEAGLREEALPAQNKMFSLHKQWDTMEKTIDKAMSQIGPFSTGFGAYLKALPASQAKALEENLKTIKANVGFNKLGEIRQQSKTGSGVGPVSDFENQLMQATEGSLDQFQDDEQLKEHLQHIKYLMNMTKKYQTEYFNKIYGRFTGSKGNSPKPPEGFELD